MSSPSGVWDRAPAENAFLAYLNATERSLLHIYGEIIGEGGQGRCLGAIVPCRYTQNRACLPWFNHKPSGERAPSWQLFRSVYSALSDAFAVLHLFSACKLCYYKTGSTGKAPIEGLGTLVPQKLKLASAKHYFIHNLQLGPILPNLYKRGKVSVGLRNVRTSVTVGVASSVADDVKMRKAPEWQ